MKQLNLPLIHRHDPRDAKMSAVTDASGKLLAGSFICQQDRSEIIEFHKRAVAAINAQEQPVVSGYKLVRQRKDGSLGPLFINARLRIPLGVWLRAEAHPTKGFAYRPGWHATLKKCAPHLSTKGRVWAKVSMRGIRKFKRPQSQGGTWVLAEFIRFDAVI